MRAKPPPSRRHTALDQACRVVQARLSERLSLSDLAAPAGVSPAHLTRLFRAELGVTATDYLRRCRLERALHLLTRSEVPVKEVACEIGIPDLHAFNKAVRRGFGVSPRELRSRGRGSSPYLVPAPRDSSERSPSERSATPNSSRSPLSSDHDLLSPKPGEGDQARA
jgi:transcriptional regulator GlxA family with amidase domain